MNASVVAIVAHARRANRRRAKKSSSPVGPASTIELARRWRPRILVDDDAQGDWRIGSGGGWRAGQNLNLPRREDALRIGRQRRGQTTEPDQAVPAAVCRGGKGDRPLLLALLVIAVPLAVVVTYDELTT